MGQRAPHRWMNLGTDSMAGQTHECIADQMLAQDDRRYFTSRCLERGQYQLHPA